MSSIVRMPLQLELVAVLLLSITIILLLIALLLTLVSTGIAGEAGVLPLAMAGETLTGEDTMDGPMIPSFTAPTGDGIPGVVPIPTTGPGVAGVAGMADITTDITPIGPVITMVTGMATTVADTVTMAETSPM